MMPAHSLLPRQKKTKGRALTYLMHRLFKHDTLISSSINGTEKFPDRLNAAKIKAIKCELRCVRYLYLYLYFRYIKVEGSDFWAYLKGEKLMIGYASKNCHKNHNLGSIQFKFCVYTHNSCRKYNQ